ncbi:hypothetical protein [Nocardiopsis oceani]
MNGDPSNPRAFWERGRTTVPGSAAPTEAPRKAATAPPAAPFAAPPMAPVPGAPRPSGPPARVGGAVAALVVALCTLVIPAFGMYLGFWFFALATNLPGIALGIFALAKVPDADEVDRYIRYTWACTFVFLALSAVFLVPVVVLAVLFLLVGV